MITLETEDNTREEKNDQPKAEDALLERGS
jgi:hypothetical protein